MAGLLPMVLLCAAIGLALAFATRRAALRSIAGLALVAIIVSRASIPPVWQDRVFLGLWISMVLTASLAYLPRGLPERWAIIAALNTGLWVGAVAAVSAARRDLMFALPAVLIVFPGALFVAKGYGVAVKVAASWIIAIGMLAGVVSLTPTPGFKPDHME